MLEQEMKVIYNTLRSSEQKVADYIFANPSEIGQLNLVSIASNAGVSTPTVIRLVKALKKSGYRQFQLEWVQQFKERKSFEPLYGFELKQEDKLCDVPVKTIATEIENIEEALKSLSIKSYEKAIEILTNASLIDIYSVENSEIIAEDLVNKLLYLGLPVRHYKDPYLQQISAGHLKKDAVCIGISYTGRSKDTIKVMKIAKKQGANIIAITTDEQCEMCKYADVVLCTGKSSTLLYGNAIFSRVSQLAIVDMIYMGIILSDYEGYTKMLDNSGKLIKERGL